MIDKLIMEKMKTEIGGPGSFSAWRKDFDSKTGGLGWEELIGHKDFMSGFKNMTGKGYGSNLNFYTRLTPEDQEIFKQYVDYQKGDDTDPMSTGNRAIENFYNSGGTTNTNEDGSPYNTPGLDSRIEKAGY